ncbi:pyridoxamine 5'-phosphate oxidase-like FMN-binding protein [Deinococcus phoenicis]|uniref:Pyridoxamine 5'-phosphate oxidase-like FMN-binding protein n=1 Tax=Deinococcus phoenicis TaxID=1476583 RepID=A0A016QQG2_9DEIO|nr:pyridoxamine 5'-phosphate oxidase family protein [Deinococcus phoenicis]EYB68323.1 pyridoxamine 5'-phosphate oxidase-like FMN-binding protein [Deinococcus phoenicis]
MSEHSEQPTREESIKTLGGIIKGVKFAMLTVTTDQGHLKAHPMTTQQTEFDGDVWFIGGKDTEQVQCMAARPQVNVSYSDPGKGNYVSIGGTAQLVEDRAKLEELWSDFYKAYFPQGIDDPNIQLIKISAHGAEYWESDGKIKTLFQMARGAVTGKPATDLGKNDTVNL